MRKFACIVSLAATVLTLGQTVASQQSPSPSEVHRNEKLETCLSGLYPSLCNHSLLSREEFVRVSEAERREKLRTCLSGLYPSLCEHDLLTPAEVKKVGEAERQENLHVCMSGLYPSLCNRSL